MIHPAPAPSFPGSRAPVLAAALAVLAAGAFADPPEALPPPSTLKTLTVEQLMDIEVTSVSKRPEKLSETASAIQVVTGEDIRRAGATSLPEALRLASNLEVAQVDSRQWAVTARGFNNVFADKLLVLIDGRSVYTPLYAGVYWDVQDTLLEDLDRIEVISGPGATQWGGNAVNGVINITTKSAKDTQGGLLTGGGGNELNDSFGVRYGAQLAPGVYYRVYGKYFDRGNSVGPKGGDSNDAWRMGQAGFRLDSDRSPGSLLTLQGDLYDGAITRAGPSDIHVAGGNLLSRWSRTLADNSDVSIQAYYDRTHRLIPGSFTQDLNTGDIDFQHRLPLGSAHDFTWGLSYRLVGDSIVNTPTNAFLPPQVTHQWFSAFVQDEIALAGDSLHGTLGSKIERNDYTGWELQPSGRLAWTPDRDHTVWGAVSRAVRTPSRVDTDLYSPATPPYRIAGGPNVVSETLVAYELGYREQVNPRLAVSLATFYNDYQNLRSIEPLSPPAAFPAVISSGLEGHSAGAELTAEWRVGPSWKVHLGWTELRTSSEPASGTEDRSTSRSIAYDANHQVFLRSSWDLSAAWELDADLRYIGPIGNMAVPGYAEADLRLGWRPAPSWELSLQGGNLLHGHHAEFNAPGTRREVPRSVYAKVTWHF